MFSSVAFLPLLLVLYVGLGLLFLEILFLSLRSAHLLDKDLIVISDSLYVGENFYKYVRNDESVQFILLHLFASAVLRATRHNISLSLLYDSKIENYDCEDYDYDYDEFY